MKIVSCSHLGLDSKLDSHTHFCLQSGWQQYSTEQLVFAPLALTVSVLYSSIYYGYSEVRATYTVTSFIPIHERFIANCIINKSRHDY